MRNISIELILGAWGAIVSTIVAIFGIVKELNEKPRISISVHNISASISEARGAHVQVQHGDDLLEENWYPELIIRNRGKLATQIICFYKDTKDSIEEIVPTGLPIVLEPRTSHVIKLQPEYFVDASFRIDEKRERLSSPEIKYHPIVSAGVIDALGKRHNIKKKNLLDLYNLYSQLSLRYGVFKNKSTGNYIIAHQAQDKIKLVKKSSKRI